MAMSGGVDSSTAAALLAENYSNGETPRVIGLTMQLWNQRRLPSLIGAGVDGPDGPAAGRCCSLDDAYDARRVAAFLNLPYYVVNIESAFEATVVHPFIASYLRGETPVPCSLCNTEIKFSRFVETALQIGADRIATGHYARIRFDSTCGRYQLLCAADRSRDQSYFLFGLTQEQLARTLFPLGELTKVEVRAIARRKNLPVADKADSQEICFVPTGNYRRFIAAYLSEQAQATAPFSGEIVSSDGRVLARHGGIHNYTIGQRKGLGFTGGKPYYVTKIDPAHQHVIVGTASELMHRQLIARDVNWIVPAREGDRFDADVKIRHQHLPAQARVEALRHCQAAVEFLEPQRAITPGQAAVFYRGEEVLGGGWIASVSD